MTKWLRYIWYAVMAILLQMLVFNNLHFLGICHPFVYVFILVFLPAGLPCWVNLLIGAAVGAIMDVISTSPGVHMAACVAVCYTRSLAIDRLIQGSERLTEVVCSATVGKPVFMGLCATIVIIHHALVFILDNGSFHNLWYILLQTAVSALLTVIVLFLVDILLSNRRNRNR